MKNLASLFAASFVLCLLAQPASAQEPSKPFLTGKWEGVMTVVGPEADGSPSVLPPMEAARGQFGYRLDIRQTNLVMYFQQGSDWIGMGEGLDLRLNQEGRSSVVIAQLRGSNPDSIEVMMLNIVRWDEDTLAVFMSRQTGAGSSGTEPPQPLVFFGRLNRADF